VKKNGEGGGGAGGNKRNHAQSRRPCSIHPRVYTDRWTVMGGRAAVAAAREIRFYAFTTWSWLHGKVHTHTRKQS
jgi:hypothetical protein